MNLNQILRRLVRMPLFSSVVVLTLAVGIGANTAIFTGLAEPEEVPTLFVTDGVLPMLGVQPALGRLLRTPMPPPAVLTR